MKLTVQRWSQVKAMKVSFQQVSAPTCMVLNSENHSSAMGEPRLVELAKLKMAAKNRLILLISKYEWHNSEKPSRIVLTMPLKYILDNEFVETHERTRLEASQSNSTFSKTALLYAFLSGLKQFLLTLGNGGKGNNLGREREKKKQLNSKSIFFFL